jgi:hypothetical protein
MSPPSPWTPRTENSSPSSCGLRRFKDSGSRTSGFEVSGEPNAQTPDVTSARRPRLASRSAVNRPAARSAESSNPALRPRSDEPLLGGRRDDPGKVVGEGVGDLVGGFGPDPGPSRTWDAAADELVGRQAELLASTPTAWRVLVATDAPAQPPLPAHHPRNAAGASGHAPGPPHARPPERSRHTLAKITADQPTRPESGRVGLLIKVGRCGVRGPASPVRSAPRSGERLR